ncbi:nickel insertion protein [Mucisphaera sp.]|uniref:nickel insertion protein n=1 Tax=Mucisphaera sp. TaxID=2913024 RepID=UPI003D0D5AF8
MSARTVSQLAEGGTVTGVVELAVNLDDTTGETIGHTVSALMDAGALDAWWTSIGMKKGRSAVMLSLLVVPDQQQAMAELVLRLTGSFGVRARAWDRVVLDRRIERVTTAYGEARVKVGSMGGRDIVARAEFEDAAELAESAGEPLRLVQAAIDAVATRRFLVDDKRGEA